VRKSLFTISTVQSWKMRIRRDIDPETLWYVLCESCDFKQAMLTEPGILAWKEVHDKDYPHHVTYVKPPTKEQT
jgi:hypothetical protein